MYEIRIVKITRIRTGKEWYKEKVGKYYAVYSEPSSKEETYFPSSYLVYRGEGAHISSHIHEDNCEVITDMFLSDDLEKTLESLQISL